MRYDWSSAGSTLALILFLFHPLPAQSGEFSLEQVMSVGFPSQMTPAPVSGGVAWVVNERGVRNIWIARPPDYQGRQLTGYGSDDGQTISQLVWTPDASAIIFVRGDGPNPRGELPNPLNLAAGTEQVILKLNTESGKVEKLADGAGPLVDPDGENLVFLREDQIWTKPLAGRRGAQTVDPRPGSGRIAEMVAKRQVSGLCQPPFRPQFCRDLRPRVERDRICGPLCRQR